MADDRTERSREAWMRYARKCAATLASYDAVVGSRFAWRAGLNRVADETDPRLEQPAIDEARKVARTNGKHIVDDSAMRELARIYDR